jgi:hypothetical protein
MTRTVAHVLREALADADRRGIRSPTLDRLSSSDVQLLSAGFLECASAVACSRCRSAARAASGPTRHAHIQTTEKYLHAPAEADQRNLDALDRMTRRLH